MAQCNKSILFRIELWLSPETFAVLTSGSIMWGSSTTANHCTRNKVVVTIKQIMLFTSLPSVVPDIRRVILSPIPNSIYAKLPLATGTLRYYSKKLLKCYSCGLDHCLNEEATRRRRSAPTLSRFGMSVTQNLHIRMQKDAAVQLTFQPLHHNHSFLFTLTR